MKNISGDAVAELIKKIGEQTLFLRVRNLALLNFLILGCTTPHPTLDYVLAREAFSAAKEVDAARYAPAYYHKAEESFRLAERNYRDHLYDEAIEEFNAAKSYSEKAENVSRVLRQKAGDEGI